MTAIGIDLGTCYCCMAYVEDDHPKIISNNYSNFVTPSYIFFGKNEILFGEVAAKKIFKDEKNTIYDVKRFIGRNFDDPLIQGFIDKWKFNLINYRGKISVAVRKEEQTKMYSPEMLSGLLLKHLKKQAEDSIGRSVTKAVITVPTYFTDAQRQATIDAGKIGGFQEVKLLNEPTAAAIAYFTDNNSRVEKTLLVFDFGGGTFDVSIVKCKDRDIKVVAIDGDVALGGNDITQKLIDNVAAKLKEKYDFDVYGSSNRNKTAYSRLKNLCEDAKKELSDSSAATLQFCDFMPDVDEEVEISRTEFNKINSEIFSRTLEIVNRCLSKINMDIDSIDEFLVVGGSSRIKKIQTMLEAFYKKPIKFTINADHAIAIGAAIVASKLTDNVCYNDLNFTDICPYSLGVETKGKHMSVIIPKYSSLPAKETKIYSNTKDNQTAVKVRIFAGEDASTENNTHISDLTISGFQPGPANSVKLYETFIYDENGILSVEVDGPCIEKKNLVINLDKGRLSEEDLLEQSEVIAGDYKDIEEFQLFKQIRENITELCNTDVLRNEVGFECDQWIDSMKKFVFSSEHLLILQEKYDELLQFYEQIK